VARKQTRNTRKQNKIHKITNLVLFVRNDKKILISCIASLWRQDKIKFFKWQNLAKSVYLSHGLMCMPSMLGYSLDNGCYRKSSREAGIFWEIPAGLNLRSFIHLIGVIRTTRLLGHQVLVSIVLQYKYVCRWQSCRGAVEKINKTLPNVVCV